MRGWLELVRQGAGEADGRLRKRRLGPDNNHLMDSELGSGWATNKRA